MFDNYKPPTHQTLTGPVLAGAFLIQPFLWYDCLQVRAKDELDQLLKSCLELRQVSSAPSSLDGSQYEPVPPQYSPHQAQTLNATGKNVIISSKTFALRVLAEQNLDVPCLHKPLVFIDVF